jgi:hypothetical protein
MSVSGETFSTAAVSSTLKRIHHMNPTIGAAAGRSNRQSSSMIRALRGWRTR